MTNFEKMLKFSKEKFSIEKAVETFTKYINDNCDSCPAWKYCLPFRNSCQSNMEEWLKGDVSNG